MRNNKLLKLRMFLTLKTLHFHHKYKNSTKRIGPFLFILLSIMFLEIITKKIIIGHIFNISLLYVLIFTIPFALLFTILTKLFNKKVNKVLLFIIIGALVVYYEVQYIFFILFSVPFSFSTIGLADQAFDFVNVINDTIVAYFGTFVSLLIPFIALIIFHKKINTDRATKMSLLAIPLLIIAYLSTFLLLQIKPDEEDSNKKLYYHLEDPVGQINRFGVLTYTKIDVKRQLVGYSTNIEEEILEPVAPTEEEQETIEEYGLNQIEFDYNKLNSNNNNINSLNSYLQKAQASNKSEYTGYFKGKNLIFILAEGFNEIAVDEQRTPTLYKMIHTGFDFTNFYSPVYLSTTGGEFQSTTGLLPTQPILKSWKSKQPTISFALGNSFKKAGYRAQSLP